MIVGIYLINFPQMLQLVPQNKTTMQCGWDVCLKATPRSIRQRRKLIGIYRDLQLQNAVILMVTGIHAGWGVNPMYVLYTSNRKSFSTTDKPRAFVFTHLILQRLLQLPLLRVHRSILQQTPTQSSRHPQLDRRENGGTRGMGVVYPIPGSSSWGKLISGAESIQ